MKTQLLGTAILVAVTCAQTQGSRKFLGCDRLDYKSCIQCEIGPCSQCEPVIGQVDREFGLCLWLKRNPSSGDQEIIDNRDLLGNGFRLHLQQSGGTITSDRIVFSYQDGEDVVACDEGITDIQFNESNEGNWIHIALDLTLPSGQVRMYVNGNQVAEWCDDSGTPSFGSMTGSEFLYIGGTPGDSFEADPCGFNGDIHDVCMTKALWDTAVLQSMQLDQPEPKAARDAILNDAVILFNPQLRGTAADADFTEIEPTVTGDLKRGMGPPITYGDQKPSVLVIGDTQALSLQNNNKLGQFIRDYKETLRIAAVFHVGDWVMFGSSDALIARARSMVEQFRSDGAFLVPWACALGNRDYDDLSAPWTVRNWSEEQNMPTLLFKENENGEPNDWFVAQMTDTGLGDPNDEGYAYAFDFELDGMRQLGIVLPHIPSTGMLDWAAAIANAHLEKKVWLVTHWFLNPETCRASLDWQSHLQNMENLAFVFSGHVCDPCGFFANHRCDHPLGDLTKDPIHQLVINGSWNAPVQGGGGFMHILAASVSGTTLDAVDVESYIPIIDEFYDPGPTWTDVCGTEEQSLQDNFTFTADFLAQCGVDCNGNLVEDSVDISSGASEDYNQNDIPDECECFCDCQPEPNGSVDASDFLALLAQWGTPGSCDCGSPPDGAVDAGDFLTLLGAWGPCP